MSITALFNRRPHAVRGLATAIAAAAVFGAAVVPFNAARADGPATRPASDSPSLTDANSVAFTSETTGVTFRVPKAWERLRTSGGAEAEDCVFAFDPSPERRQQRSTNSRVPPRPKAQQRFTVLLGQPCERQTQLAEVVADNRAGLRRMDPDVQFEKDEAIDLNGRQAWVLAWPETQTAIVTIVRNGKPTRREVKLKTMRQRVTWLQNDTICEMSMEVDAGQYRRLERAGEQVQESIEWSEPS